MHAAVPCIATLVVPTYNPGTVWKLWTQGLQCQTTPPARVVIVDSGTADKTDFTLDNMSVQIKTTDAKVFNHGRTRNEALEWLDPATEVVVFLTQDAVLSEPSSLATLLQSFSDPSVACAFGRQLPHANATPLASHARLFNYGPVARTVTLASAAHLGIKACFMSNSFAAYRLSDLRSVGGFPGNVILGEDTTVAARLLLAGKAIRYQADACVYHSHNYTPFEEFRRYFDTGVFHAREKWLLDAFGGASGEGLRFVKSELRYLLQKAPWLIPSALLRTACKLAGYRLGRAEARLPVGLKRHLSMFRGFWG